MTENDFKKQAESLYPSQKGKHWVRTLRDAKVAAFIQGALFAQQQVNNLNLDDVSKCDGIKSRERKTVLYNCDCEKGDFITTEICLSCAGIKK